MPYQYPLAFRQDFIDRMLRGVITSLHFVLLAHKGNLGLTKQLDMNPFFGPGLC